MPRNKLQLKPIDISTFAPGTRTDFRLPVYQDALGNEIRLPFIVMRGMESGPTLGICAVVHGNELNGIGIIHHVLDGLDPRVMRGSLVCAPVVNAPGFEYGVRHFPIDDVDLNHVFPGSSKGTPSQQYARGFLKTFLPACEYLIDIHTASDGRLNTLYARADLHNPAAREMAALIEPKIILHGRSGDGTLRNAARRRGIPAITLEAGNPSVIQGRMVIEGEQGVRNILAHLGISPNGDGASHDLSPAFVCRSSKWLRTTAGGLLHCRFELGELVEKGRPMAEVVDLFGDVVSTYKAPHDGIVIGMAQRPVSVPGTRFCHLGVPGEPEGERP